MISALVFAAVALAPNVQTVTPLLRDDIWVYPNAADPEKDQYLRAWGAEDRSVPTDADSASKFSFSYLQWDLKDLPADAKLTSAKLVLTHIPDPGWDDALARANPLEVRPLRAGFEQAGWNYGQIANYFPGVGEKDLYGKVSPTAGAEGKEFAVTVDLLQGPADFRKAFDAARATDSKLLAVALTAGLDPEAQGMRCIYKFFSKQARAETTPRLELTLEKP